MAGRVPARLTAGAYTAAQGRKFGLTVGLAFAALGGALAWRGRPTASTVLFALGGALVLAGLVVPASLGPVERAWMGLAHRISKVTTPIFMGVVYFLVMTPAGVLRRRFGSPITTPPAPGASRWEPHPIATPTAARMERQF
jgi:hypothetical protein